MLHYVCATDWDDMATGWLGLQHNFDPLIRMNAVFHANWFGFGGHTQIQMVVCHIGVRMRWWVNTKKANNGPPGRNIFIIYPIGCRVLAKRATRQNNLNWLNLALISEVDANVPSIWFTIRFVHFFFPEKNRFYGENGSPTSRPKLHARYIEFLAWYTNVPQITFTITKLKSKNGKTELKWFDGSSYYFCNGYVALLFAPISYD